jgi:hypothetical protein
MDTGQTIIAHGRLGENGDTFFIASEHMLLIDAHFLVDPLLMGKTVSVIGRMGIPPSAPGITKLLADKIVAHEAIAIRAFDIFKSGAGGAQNDNWLQAEQELLH